MAETGRKMRFVGGPYNRSPPNYMKTGADSYSDGIRAQKSRLKYQPALYS